MVWVPGSRGQAGFAGPIHNSVRFPGGGLCAVLLENEEVAYIDRTGKVVIRAPAGTELIAYFPGID